MDIREWRDTIDGLSDQLRGLFLYLVGYLYGANTEEEIAMRLAQGVSPEQVIEGLEEAATRWASGWGEAHDTAARGEAGYVEHQIEVLVRYDTTNHAAVRAMQDAKLDQIKGFTQAQVDVVRQVMIRDVTEGLNPRVTAQQIRQSIGLTAYQEGIVDNYRRALQSLDAGGALYRELTDGRYDRAVANAIDQGRPLTQAQVDRYVEAYRNNWIGYRAETIARTEGLRAAHEGSDAFFDQAVAEGVLTNNEITEEWHHFNGGKDARDFHETMNNVKVKRGTPFVSGLGNQLRYPCDPQAPAVEVCNCRCAKTQTVRPRSRRSAEADQNA
jgi:hypothetical protein